MIVRNDFNSESFDQLVRTELLDQLSVLVMDEGVDTKLIEAFQRVIAYNSVPGTYMEGVWDNEY